MANESLKILLSLAALSLVAGVLIYIALKIKKNYTTEDDSPPQSFSLADLRRLHRDGKLTDHEFETAKAAVIASTNASLAPPTTPDTPPTDPPNPLDAPDPPDTTP